MRALVVLATIAAMVGIAIAVTGAHAQYDPPPPVSRPAVVPSSGRYEATDIPGSPQMLVAFRPDGWVVMREPDGPLETGCPEGWAELGQGGWDGSGYATHVRTWEPRADLGDTVATCRPAFHFERARVEPLSDGLFDLCSEEFPDLERSERCSTWLRVGSSYRADLVAWIPHGTIVDPALTIPLTGVADDVLSLAPAALRPCIGADVVESAIGGQDHRELAEPLLAVVRASFDVDAHGRLTTLRSWVAPMSVGRLLTGSLESGAQVSCDQEVTLTHEQVGTVVRIADDTISLKIDTQLAVVPTGHADVAADGASVLTALGCGGTGLSCSVEEVVPFVPRIRAALDLVVKPDGTMTVHGSTGSFSSIGLRLEADGEPVTSVVLNDASCFRLAGDGGFTNLHALASRVRTIDVRPIGALRDDPCIPVALPGDGIDPLDGQGADPEAVAVLLIATRYAAGR